VAAFQINVEIGDERLLLRIRDQIFPGASMPSIPE